MAATSPERYKAFMAKQMEEKKKLDEDTKPPTPVFAIRALLVGTLRLDTSSHVLSLAGVGTCG